MNFKSNCEAAQYYAQHKIRVLPLHACKEGLCSCGKNGCVGKHPRTLNGAKDATMDITIINEWWRQWPEAGVGLATGKESDLVVVDADAKHGGLESLEQLRKLCPEFPKEPNVFTGGGGHHYYFHYANQEVEIRNTTRLAGLNGIDVRGEGGYVVAPPSVHASGKCYIFNTTGCDLIMHHIPDQLLKMLLNPRVSLMENSPGTSKQSNITGWVENAVKNLKEGNRNETFARLTGKLKQSGLSLDEALTFLIPLAEKTGFSAEELEREVHGIYDRYLDQPPRTKPQLTLSSLSDLLKEPEETLNWLVEDMLPCGGIGVLAAKPKVGKSTLARYLAFCIAKGIPFLGRATEKGLVVYLALEERKEDIKRHFKNMGADTDLIKFFIGTAPRDAIEQLRLIALSEKPALIIIDTLARIVRVQNINDYSQTTNGLEPFLSLARETNSAVLLIHHARKGSSDGIDSVLGSTAIAGTVDTIIQMKKRGDELRSVSSEQRTGKNLCETVVSYDEISGICEISETVFEMNQHEMESQIMDYLSTLSEAVREDLIEESVEGNKQSRIRALRDLVYRGRILRSGKGCKGDPYLYEISKNTGIQVLGIDCKPEYEKNGL